MHPFPHHYVVGAQAESGGDIRISSNGLPALETAAPAEFGGPGDRWSPETLLVGAVADCFVLSFKAIAVASKFEWKEVNCDAEGILDRVDGVTRFTEMHLRVQLVVPAGTDPDRAQRILEKAERVCLITNSLALTPTLECDVRVA